MENKTFAEIPSPFHQIFQHYSTFNAVQSSLFNTLLHTNKSVVLSAPTGSGKTVAFELAIVRMLLERQQQQQQNQSQQIPPSPKAVYVAPIKALCAERYADWKLRFEPVGIKCLLITGDSELDELSRLREAQVIITTPEKWDSLTRHWRDCSDAISSVHLFLVDEVHLLNEDVRGPVLEAIVSRMHTIARDTMDKVLRIVVASATIPNVSDITRWIAGIGVQRKYYNKKTSDEHVTQLVFSDSDRPVPLEKHVLGFNSCSRGFKFDLSLNYKLMEILRKYSDCKATLIFCSSRKSAEMAANVLEKNISTHFALSDQQKENLVQLAQKLNDSKLCKLITHGIAFHHAGMSLSDRNQIETSFRQGNIMVLLCTNTLAMGVNLPAHLVVIKSTEYYHFGKMIEYPESTLLQMIGRAGRPQYDTKGVAVILTHKRNAQKYEALVDGKMPIESHLHKHLAEHLNSEIALGTINNLEVAMNWMRSTYFYVRSMQNPSYYGLDENMDKDIIENKLEKMCLVQIQDLETAGLITRNPQNELDVQTTSYGKLMAKYYICFETMKLFRQIRGDETYLKILELVVRCREFGEFTLRVNEKRILNALNDTPLRFPRAGRIKTREDKIACLLQAVLGNVTIASPTLAQESLKMTRIADRIAKCLLEYMRLSEHQAHAFHLGRYKALLHTVTIAKCFYAKLWENSEHAAKQLQKIGAVYSAQLVNAGKTTLKSLEMTDARIIEAILSKSYPFGDEILQHLQQTFPKYICSLKMVYDSQSMLQISVRQVNESFIYRGTNAMIIVGDSSNQLLLFIEDLDALLVEYGCFMKTIKLPNPDVEKVYAHVIHATLVGVDVHETLVLKEPADECSLEIKTKKSRKRKQQTLNETISGKKSKPSSKICNNPRNNSTTVTKKTNINLQSFQFSKSKILNDSVIAKFEENETTVEGLEENDTKVTEVQRNNITIPNVEQNHSTNSKFEQNKKSLKINNNNYIHLTNNIVNEESFYKTTNTTNNDSALVQTKLTKFFKEKKCNTNKSFTTPSTMQAKQNDMDFDKLIESQIKEKNERNPTLSCMLQGRTPELNEISAFLETQKSRESRESSQTTKELAEKQKFRECDEMSPQTKQANEISAIPNTQTSTYALSNGTQFSMIFDTPKSTEDMRNNNTTPEMSEELTTENIENNNIKPLDLTRKQNMLHCAQGENEAPLTTVCTTIDHLYLNNFVTKSLNTGIVKTPTLRPNNNLLCGLDLSAQNAQHNRNMSWRDDSTKDDVSVMSTTLTNKSSETLTNSPKNIENFLLCYKVALAFARLKEEERNIVSFKNIYQRTWRTSTAIDYITAKLSNSVISRGINEAVDPRKATIPFQEMQQLVPQYPTQKHIDIPLNLAKKAAVLKSIKEKENILPSCPFKAAQLKQSRYMKNSMENRVHKTMEQSKVALSNTRRNPFRLQILNDLKKKNLTTKTLNNEVMHSVLNKKCALIAKSENTDIMVTEDQKSLTCKDFMEIERELELNKTQESPSMSFKEYCNYFLQSPNN